MPSRHNGFISICLLACLTLAATGCVSQDAYDRQQRALRTSQGQIIELQQRLEEKDAVIAALRLQLTGDSSLQDQLAASLAERERLRLALADAEQALRDLSHQVGPLPAELDRDLEGLAAAFPGLMRYDAQLGRVVFESDLTFAPGSVDLSPDATTSLQQLASIISKPIAAKYEVRIVGHTDNVPIRRPATLQNHPTNWHLSVHRAISVKDVLESTGVPAVRLGVAGYGQHRPVAPNGAGGNRANRRVEIYLVPNPAMGAGGAADAAARAAAPAEVPVEMGIAPGDASEEDPSLFK